MKRRPGRPLSTSATARSLVKELAALHIGRSHAQNDGQLLITSFEPTLPAFPEVSAYIDGSYDDNEVRLRDDKQVKQQEDIERRSSDAERTFGRTNKVLAKKQREMTKDRVKNASCPGCVCHYPKTDI